MLRALLKKARIRQDELALALVRYFWYAFAIGLTWLGFMEVAALPVPAFWVLGLIVIGACCCAFVGYTVCFWILFGIFILR